MASRLDALYVALTNGKSEEATSEEEAAESQDSLQKEDGVGAALDEPDSSDGSARSGGSELRHVSSGPRHVSVCQGSLPATSAAVGSEQAAERV